MSNEAWNRITQTHDLFKKIIAPLKEHLGINFGYMIVFNDGSYYQIIEDLKCLENSLTKVLFVSRPDRFCYKLNHSNASIYNHILLFNVYF
jgi:hypothetical protein